MSEEFTRSSKFRQKPVVLQLPGETGFSRISVRASPKLANCNRGVITFGPHHVPCVLGRAGVGVKWREGDGKTPTGLFRIVRWLHRPSAWPVRKPGSVPIRPTDGWCDDPASQQYNRQVTLPFRAGAEKLWRNDALYDVIGVVNFNFRPRAIGRGSAIFLHLARPDLAPTEGCVAVERRHMLKLQTLLRPKVRIAIGDIHVPRAPKIAVPTRTKLAPS